MPWNFCSALFSLGFYALGNILKPLLNKYIFENDNKLLNIALVILFAGVCFPLALLNGEVSIGHRVLHNGILLYITGITGTFMVLSLSKLINRSKLLSFMGKNSFYFMAVHYIIMGLIITFSDLINKKISLIPQLSKNSLKDAIIIFVLDVIFSILFVLLYRGIVYKIKVLYYQKNVAVSQCDDSE